MYLMATAYCCWLLLMKKVIPRDSITMHTGTQKSELTPDNKVYYVPFNYDYVGNKIRQVDARAMQVFQI